MKLLNERDGLALGICNGFQALIKLGLVPYGEITPQQPDSPTLTTNNIGRHISRWLIQRLSLINPHGWQVRYLVKSMQSRFPMAKDVS